MHALLLALLPALSAPAPSIDDGPLKCAGSLVPAEATELSLWPSDSLGSTLFVEVLPHGSLVSEGEVVARLDPEAQEKKVEAARDGVKAAERALRVLIERQRMAEENDAARLDASARELERASQALDDFLKVELPFRRRSEDQTRRSRLASIEDQEHELAQLESMYQEDELTDATEEIVLQRARRALSLSRLSFQLNEERTAHRRDHDEKIEIARKREALGDQQRAARHLATEMQFGSEDRAEARTAAEKALDEARRSLRRTEEHLAMMTLRAPRAGVLLHGGLDAYAPGKTAPRHEKGSNAALRSALFTVAAPDRWAVAFEIPESHRRRVREGMTARLQIRYLGERELSGTVSVDRMPSPKNDFPARLELDASLPGLAAGMSAELSLELGEDE